MGKSQVLEGIKEIEEKIGTSLPSLYKKYLIEEIQDAESYEVLTKDEDNVYLYSYELLPERNETYDIQGTDPNCFMIGQDGDTGYFIKLSNNDEKIYCLGLGALGCIDMRGAANNIYELGNKV